MAASMFMCACMNAHRRPRTHNKQQAGGLSDLRRRHMTECETYKSITSAWEPTHDQNTAPLKAAT